MAMFIATATIGSGMKKEVLILGTIEADSYREGLETLERMAREAGLEVRNHHGGLWTRHGYLGLVHPEPVRSAAFTLVKMMESRVGAEKVPRVIRVVVAGEI